MLRNNNQVVKISISASTDIGNRRTNNEDSFIATNDVSKSEWSFGTGTIDLAKDGIALVVADGMGGEVAGELASSIAIKTIQNELSKRLIDIRDENEIIVVLRASLVTAHQKIIEFVKSHPEYYGMGTTGTICYILKNRLYIVWVGDSRVYRFLSEGTHNMQKFHVRNLEILTDDHSKVWESVLAGTMTPEEARVADNSNIITQSLGDLGNGPRPESRAYNIYAGDIILACSDGLNSMVSDDVIAGVFENIHQVDDLKTNLIKVAKEAGGYDNITIALCKIEEGDIRNNSISKTDDLVSIHSAMIKVKDHEVETLPVKEIANEIEELRQKRTTGKLNSIFKFLLYFIPAIAFLFLLLFLFSSPTPTNSWSDLKNESKKNISQAKENENVTTEDNSKDASNQQKLDANEKNSDPSELTSDDKYTPKVYEYGNVKARQKEMVLKLAEFLTFVRQEEFFRMDKRYNDIVIILENPKDSLLANKEYLRETNILIEEIDNKINEK